MSKKPATCPACLQNVSEILEFSAPMEFPISRVEMKDEIEEKKGIDVRLFHYDLISIPLY